MTNEEKQLLIKDICARLPYGVICDRLGQTKKLLSVSPYKAYCLEFDNGEYMPGEYTVEDIKPYLRPMSSMTEEEKEEFENLVFKYNFGDIQFPIENTIMYWDSFEEVLDYLISHHFDYRGLIPMGLALEAPEGMYE